MSRENSPHIISLDGLRGIAIIMVLCFHLFVYGIFRNVFYFGWSGVDLFFVLSGFLITGILLDTKGSAHYFSNFWLRRVLRIFPLYYAVLILMAVAAPWFPPTAWFGHYQWYFWTYTSNYLILQKGFFRPLGHLWSLSIEEQFYFVWPLVVYWLHPKKLIACCLVVVLLGIVIRYCWLNEYLTFGFPPAHLDGLMVGAVLAVLTRYNNELLFRYVDHLLLLFLVLFIAYTAIYLLQYGIRQQSLFVRWPLTLTLVSLVFGGLLVLLLKYPQFARLVSARPLLFFSKYSYGMYLFNSIFFYLSNWAGADRLTALQQQFVYIGVFALTVGVSYLSYHLFEIHFLRLKKNFSKN